MFDVDGWGFWLLVSIIAVVGIAGRYRTMGLESPQKELSGLSNSFAILSIVTIFLLLSLPDFYFYSDIPPEITNLDGALELLRKQDKSLKELSQSMNKFKFTFSLLLIVLLVSLSSIPNFAKAVVTPTVEKTDSVLGLNDDEN